MNYPNQSRALHWKFSKKWW